MGGPDGDRREVHRPVMVREVLEVLAPSPGETFLDLTLGAGGHAGEIARRIGPTGTLIGVDADSAILEYARRRLAGTPLERLVIEQGNFAGFGRVLERAGLDKVDGILADLGVSSLQIEEAGRGFSFSREGPLDMRMNRDGAGPTAADVVNREPADELARIFRQYGEERHARRIAEIIVAERAREPIATTTRLAAIAARVYGRRRQRIDPATRIFQALRIEVNLELDSLQTMLSLAPTLLRKGGRLAVISFHSLEDRIVKDDFRTRADEGLYTLITRKPLRPTPQEVSENPRARSARLRGAQRSVQ
jgi:16S rRNA (cytosine1402-N4)-methyltransferase